MNKTTKGALAAAAAGVLLLGGAGTLAYWTDSATVSGIDVKSGELKIINDNCDGADWVFDGGEATPNKIYASGDLIVPGDVLTKDCTFEIKATGEHLRATLAITNPSLSGDLSDDLQYNGTFVVGATPLANGDITEQNDGDVVHATITVTFPYGDATTVSANDTQDLTGSLSDFSVALTQVHTP